MRLQRAPQVRVRGRRHGCERAIGQGDLHARHLQPRACAVCWSGSADASHLLSCRCRGMLDSQGCLYWSSHQAESLVDKPCTSVLLGISSASQSSLLYIP